MIRPFGARIVSDASNDLETRALEHPLKILRGEQAHSFDVFLPALPQPNGFLNEAIIGTYGSCLLDSDSVLHALVVWNEVRPHFRSVEKIDHERAALPQSFADTDQHPLVLTIVLEIAEAREKVD